MMQICNSTNYICRLDNRKNRQSYSVYNIDTKMS